MKQPPPQISSSFGNKQVNATLFLYAKIGYIDKINKKHQNTKFWNFSVQSINQHSTWLNKSTNNRRVIVLVKWGNVYHYQFH